MYSYFNECLPRDKVVEQYASALQETAMAFDLIKSKHDVLDGIVTISDWNSVLMSDAIITLGDCIKKIE